jgi:hypothetical protein
MQAWLRTPGLTTVLALVASLALSIVGLATAAAVAYVPPPPRPVPLARIPLPPPAPLPQEPETPPPETQDPVLLARAILIETARPGGTMSMIGRDKAIGWLHPEYALRAARITRRARAEGIKASCASAYRPFGLGIGGFKNKRHSRHTFGTACDWTGIGKPGSKTALRFHRIASEEGLCNPYGPRHRAEWNHYQLGCAKKVPLGHPLQRTVNARGPVDLDAMWRLTGSLIGGVTDTVAFGLASAQSVVALALPVAKTGKTAKAKQRYAKRRTDSRRHRT